MLAVRFPVSRRRFYAGTWLSTSVHVESTPSFLPLRTAAVGFFFLFSSFFPTSAHTLSNLLSANRLSFMTRPSSFSHPVTVYHSWLVLFLLSSHLHHSLPPSTAGATWRSHVTLECVMLEPCVGAARKKQGWSCRDIPQFVVGYENYQRDMGQMDAGMKNEMFREEEMDDDDESVSSRCTILI